MAVWHYEITTWAQEGRTFGPIHYYGSFSDEEFHRTRVTRILDDYQAARLNREEYEARKHLLRLGDHWRDPLHEAGEETERFTTKQELLDRMVEVWRTVAKPGDMLVEHEEFMYDEIDTPLAVM